LFEKLRVEKSPDAFRTISEAAEELDLPQHVLRFWETRFSNIKPLKRGGGRRYYRPDDVLLLKGIRHLLYDQGFTIKGVQKILKDQGVRQVIAIGENGAAETVSAPSGELVALPALNGAGLLLDKRKQEQLSGIMRELLDCKRLLDASRES
jgi:DNA-binding transcriptional MerR regulator